MGASKPFKLGLQRGPGNAVAPVLVKGFEAAVEFCSLEGGEGKLVGIKAIPKLRDQRQALRRGQPGKFVLFRSIHG